MIEVAVAVGSMPHTASVANMTVPYFLERPTRPTA